MISMRQFLILLKISAFQNLINAELELLKAKAVQ